MNEPNEQLMTTGEVAQMYRVSKQTVLRWVAQGLPCQRPSENVVRFHPQSVQDWVDARTVALTSIQDDDPAEGEE